MLSLATVPDVYMLVKCSVTVNMFAVAFKGMIMIAVKEVIMP